MITKLTAGIKVSVEIQYNAKQSHPIASHYFFVYSITITNVSDYTVQLKKRHWYIFDSNGIKSEVEGEGVVGEQPILIPGSLINMFLAVIFHLIWGRWKASISWNEKLTGNCLTLRFRHL